MGGSYKYELTSMSLDRFQRIFYDSVFGSLCRGHNDIRELVENPTDELLAQVAIASGYYRERAIDYVAARALYLEFVNKLGLVDPTLPTYLRDTMLFCAPPHTRVDHNCGLNTATCGQSSFCPGCRMRTQEMIFYRMLPQINSVSKIATLSVTITPAVAPRVPSIEDSVALKEVIDKIYGRRWNNWPYDVAWSLPRYIPSRDRWVMLCTIIALVTDIKQLWDPHAKVGLNTKWQVYPASPIKLAEVIAKTTSYQAQMLYKNQFKNEEFVRIHSACRGLPGDRPPLRLRFHGLPKPKKAMDPIMIINNSLEDITDDTNTRNNECNTIGRPALETADLEQPSGYNGGLLGIIYPDN